MPAEVIRAARKLALQSPGPRSPSSVNGAVGDSAQHKRAEAALERAACRLFDECLTDFFANKVPVWPGHEKQAERARQSTTPGECGFSVSLLGIGTQNFLRIDQSKPGNGSDYFGEKRRVPQTPHQHEIVAKRGKVESPSKREIVPLSQQWACSKCTFVNVIGQQSAIRPVARGFSCSMCGHSAAHVEFISKDNEHASRDASRINRKAVSKRSMTTAESSDEPFIDAAAVMAAAAKARLDRSRFVDLTQFVPTSERELYGLSGFHS